MKKNGFIAPVIVLMAICFVFAFLLSYVNSITEPIITEANELAAEQAKKEVLADADSFTEITDLELPDTVVSAFCADNGAGNVFILDGAGYGGTMEIIVGIDADGCITGTQVLDHSETAGLGARVTLDSWNDQFLGEDSALSGVSIISGSTISSNCFIGLVEDAFEADSILKAEGV